MELYNIEVGKKTVLNASMQCNVPGSDFDYNLDQMLNAQWRLESNFQILRRH